MKYQNSRKTPRRGQIYFRRKTRHPKVWIRKDIFEKWGRIVLLCRSGEKELLEEVMKQTELIYAGAVNGEVTTVIHNNSIITLLTPVSLFCSVLRTEKNEAPLKGARIKVTPEAYLRARTIARYTGMPMNIVLSIAVSVAVEISDPSVLGTKLLKHPSLFRQ